YASNGKAIVRVPGVLVEAVPENQVEASMPAQHTASPTETTPYARFREKVLSFFASPAFDRPFEPWSNLDDPRMKMPWSALHDISEGVTEPVVFVDILGVDIDLFRFAAFADLPGLAVAAEPKECKLLFQFNGGCGILMGARKK